MNTLPLQPSAERGAFSDFEACRNTQQGPVVILASGASAKHFPLGEFAHLPIITMNGSVAMTAEHGVKPFFYVCTDKSFCQQQPALFATAVRDSERLALWPEQYARADVPAHTQCYALHKADTPSLLDGLRGHGDSAWAPDGKSLYVTAPHLGQVKLFAVAVADGNRFVMFRNDGDALLINLVDPATPEISTSNRSGANPEVRDLDENLAAWSDESTAPVEPPVADAIETDASSDAPVEPAPEPIVESASEPLTLLDGQKVIGQDAASSLSALSGLTPPADSPALSLASCRAAAELWVLTTSSTSRSNSERTCGSTFIGGTPAGAGTSTPRRSNDHRSAGWTRSAPASSCTSRPSLSGGATKSPR